MKPVTMLFRTLSWIAVLTLVLGAQARPLDAETLSFSYTSLGRLNNVTTQAAHRISYSYDAAGNLLAKASGTVAAAPSMSMTVTGKTVSLSWDPVANALGYELVYAPYPYTGLASIGTIPLGNVTGFTVDLWSGAAYYMAVRALNAVGSSGYSNIDYFILP